MKKLFKVTHMQNSNLTLRWMAILAIFVASMCSLSAEPISPDAIRKLLPHTVPPYSNEEIQNLDKLEQLGEAAYPALCQEMLAPHDEHIVQTIIAVLIKSKGDKTLPLSAIRKLAILRASEEHLRSTVVKALGKIGTPEDLLYLHKQMDDPDIGNQFDTVWSLGQIGGKDSIPLIEAWAAKNSGDKFATEDAKKAIESINQRAKAQSSGK